MTTLRWGGMMIALTVLLASPARTAGSGNYDVERYDLALRFFPLSRSFEGSVTAVAAAGHGADSITLDASLRLLTIDSVFLNGIPAGFRREGDALILPASAPGDSRRTFSLRIVYHGIAGFSGTYDAGGILFTRQEGMDHIATISEPNFARTWWPCHDIPSDKAVVTVAITVPAPLRGVSNGVETGPAESTPGKEPGETWLTYRWASRYPIATYLLAVAAAPYAEINETYQGRDGREMPVVYYLYPQDTARGKADFANIRNAIGFFDSAFCPYPFAEEKFAIAEVDGDMTMENQTLCTVQATLLTGDRRNELTFIHELAHHWWGNLVTPHDWTQTWLSEGFATYAEALYLERTRGREVYQQYIDNMMAQPQGSYAGSVIGRSDTSFWDSFASRVYYKSAIVLHMLRGIMGEGAFFQAMRSYLADETLRYRTARTADFVRHCSAAHGSPLDWFFDQWISASTDAIDRPSLAVSWSRTGSTAVELVIRQTTSRQMLYRLPLDVDVVTATGAQRFSIVDSLAEQVFRLTPVNEPSAVRIDPEKKVFKLLTEQEYR